MSADRIAVCQHPNGGDYVPADHIANGKCFMDCDCTPRVYVAEDVAEAERARLRRPSEVDACNRLWAVLSRRTA